MIECDVCLGLHICPYHGLALGVVLSQTTEALLGGHARLQLSGEQHCGIAYEEVLAEEMLTERVSANTLCSY